MNTTTSTRQRNRFDRGDKRIKKTSATFLGHVWAINKRPIFTNHIAETAFTDAAIITTRDIKTSPRTVHAYKLYHYDPARAAASDESFLRQSNSTTTAFKEEQQHPFYTI